ncbi:MAG: 2OG-Fe(II) oxygenase [Saprospiraceae bacterium]|nr:2OG-Fe(II) oxygenase [Saprospiraceae bacterium]
MMIKNDHWLNPNARCDRREHPFIHAIIRNAFDPALLSRVAAEFPESMPKKYNDDKQVKEAAPGTEAMGPTTRELVAYLRDEPFLRLLQDLTGIKETLISDPYFDGGGLHEIKRGGFLKIHADFNKHKLTGLDRRVNVLIYLNNDWKEEWGGHLELWDRDMTACQSRIAPQFNTMVIFNTDDFSYHGHPDPLNCPPTRSRRSLALYYYSNGRPSHEVSGTHSTLFKKRKGIDRFRKSRHEIVKDWVPPIIVRAIHNMRKHD